MTHEEVSTLYKKLTPGERGFMDAKLGGAQLPACIEAIGKDSIKVPKSSAKKSGFGKWMNARMKAYEDAVQEMARNAALGNAVMSQAERRMICAQIVRTPAGQVTADSSLAQSVKTTIGEYGSMTEVKMPDKLRALELDAKLSGDLKDGGGGGGSVNITIEGVLKNLSDTSSIPLARKHVEELPAPEPVIDVESEDIDDEDCF